MPITNQPQATALVNVLHVIRQTRGHGVSDWHPKAIENTLRDHHTHPAPYADIVAAMVRYAKDSEKTVPSFLWDALATWAPPGQVGPRNPCEDHPEQDSRACSCCAADILVGQRPAEYRGRHYDIADTLDTAWGG